MNNARLENVNILFIREIYIMMAKREREFDEKMLKSIVDWFRGWKFRLRISDFRFYLRFRKNPKSEIRNLKSSIEFSLPSSQSPGMETISLYHDAVHKLHNY